MAKCRSDEPGSRVSERRNWDDDKSDNNGVTVTQFAPIVHGSTRVYQFKACGRVGATFGEQQYMLIVLLIHILKTSHM